MPHTYKSNQIKAKHPSLTPPPYPGSPLESSRIDYRACRCVVEGCLHVSLMLRPEKKCGLELQYHTIVST